MTKNFEYLKKLIKPAVLCLVAQALIIPAPALADKTGAKKNWMSEYVQLRVGARNLRALSSQGSLPTSADLESFISPRIVGGTNASASDNPFQVALLTKNVQNNAFAQFCGGSLVKPNVVVTAAHCSDFISANDVQVLTGTRRLDGSGNRFNVAEIIIHPDFNDQTYDNDVAVWRLSNDATGIPVAIPATDDGPVGGNLLTTGWGTLAEGGNMSINLKKVTVPLVSRANCNDSNSYNGAITDRMLCAGIDAGGLDACQGDSGGPLTRGINNSVLTGITSWGIGCARANLPGVYTRMSEASIQTFVEKNINAADSVAANSSHGFHFEFADKHQFYLESVYPITTNGRLTYEWDNVRDPGPSRFIRRLNVINKSNFPVNFKLKVTPIDLALTKHEVELDSTKSVAANGVHGFHFEMSDKHQFYMESVYPTTLNGRLTYQWDNVRDPGDSRFIRRLSVINKSNFPVTFKIKVIKIRQSKSSGYGLSRIPGINQTSVGGMTKTELLSKTSSVAAKGNHGFHFEFKDKHAFYLESVYPTTVNGRLTYEWDNVRDPGDARFIRRLNVINKSNFPVNFKIKVLGVTVTPAQQMHQ